MDRLSSDRRSANMRMIRSRDTKPEVFVRSLIHRMGFRFRLHVKDLPGRPDIVLPRLGKVVFVHGCFWHQHSQCREGRVPKSRRDYWRPKLERNVERDAEHRHELRRLGWKSLVVWECELDRSDTLRARLSKFLQGHA
ncbi:MAG: DNA mismatch endonuclease Vsr [Acidobacteriaceae bacterium]